MTWRAIELAKPAGYADHKPPYDFKHGWVPITGTAKVATTPKIENPEDLDKLTPEQLEKIPRLQRHGPSKAQGTSLERWREIVNTSLAKSDEPSTAPEAPALPTKTAPSRSKTPALAPPVAAGDTTGLSGTQSRSLADPDSVEPDEFTAEWSSATRSSQKLTPEELEATHQWQNGYTEAFAESGTPEVGLYEVINDMQRNGGRFDLGELDDEDLENLDRMRESMASALAKSKTTRDVTVFRGVSNLGNVQVGDTVTDPGWQATSYRPDIAQGFMSGAQLGAKKTKKSRMLVITVPKGKNALAVRERKDIEKVFGIKHEIVLGPDTPMRITKIDGDRIYLEVQ